MRLRKVLNILVIALILAAVSMKAAGEDKIFSSWEDVIQAPGSDFFYAQISDMYAPGN
jgi:hypothetical protein